MAKQEIAWIRGQEIRLDILEDILDILEDVREDILIIQTSWITPRITTGCVRMCTDIYEYPYISVHILEFKITSSYTACALRLGIGPGLLVIGVCSSTVGDGSRSTGARSRPATRGTSPRSRVTWPV